MASYNYKVIEPTEGHPERVLVLQDTAQLDEDGKPIQVTAIVIKAADDPSVWFDYLVSQRSTV
jgi:hypothetical protein